MNDYLPVLYFLKPRITRDLLINFLCTHVTSLAGFAGWLVGNSVFRAELARGQTNRR